MGIRLLVVDDNPHLRWGGRVHPVNATFHRFVAGLLDLPGSPVASIVHAVPLRDADVRPSTLPLDPRVRVLGTEPFDGIEGYLRHLPHMLRANRPRLQRAVAAADLAWIKVPASNAALAAALAAKARVPRMAWVAGSAAEVARARERGVRGVAGAIVGAGYDAIGFAAGLGGDRVVVGEGLVDPGGTPGTGLATSLVTAAEVRDPAVRVGQPERASLRIAWAGRVNPGKGLEWLLEELATEARDGAGTTLDVIGDGPARTALESRAASLAVGDRVRWHGYIADRTPYLDLLAAADAFVFPSMAEGFPKVVLDAWAVGVPVLARPAVRPLQPAIWTAVVPIGDRLAPALDALAAGGAAAALAAAGHRLAAAHTMQAELGRLVQRWQDRWPALPWA